MNLPKLSKSVGNLTIVNTKFTLWLDKELDKHNWSRADLSREAKISQAALSHVYSGKRGVGKDLCDSIARALRLPPDVVYRAAGLLPPVSKETQEIRELSYLFDALPEQRKSDLLDFARHLVTLTSKRGENVKDATKKT